MVLEELGRAVARALPGHRGGHRALLACGESTLLRQSPPPNATWRWPSGLATAPTTPSRTACCWFRPPPVGCRWDATRPLVDLEFTAAPAHPVARGAVAATAITAALTAGAALLASEQVGVAQWCLDTTVDYVRQRHQFGRPVGSFQAVKHRLADLWVELTEARAVARYAADLLGAAPADGRAVGSEAALAAALAQAYCGPVAVRAAETCVQLHGGLGFTWEHPAHLYLKRAKSTAIAFGTADRHREALARLVDLPGPGTADGVTNRCTGR